MSEPATTVAPRDLAPPGASWCLLMSATDSTSGATPSQCWQWPTHRSGPMCWQCCGASRYATPTSPVLVATARRCPPGWIPTSGPGVGVRPASPPASLWTGSPATARLTRDCYKSGVGLEVEWNNKDPFLGQGPQQLPAAVRAAGDRGGHHLHPLRRTSDDLWQPWPWLVLRHGHHPHVEAAATPRGRGRRGLPDPRRRYPLRPTPTAEISRAQGAVEFRPLRGRGFTAYSSECYGVRHLLHFPLMRRTVSQRELRNDAAGVLRDVQRGETMIVTRSGTPVAELRPLPTSQFVPRAVIADAARSAPRVDGARFRLEVDAIVDQSIDG